MEEKIVQLAALLHDIGKFWQGAGECGNHEELSCRFIQEHVPVQWQGAAGIVMLHHDPSKYKSKGYKPLKIIVCSDWLSSGERRKLSEAEEKGARKNTPLKSIFSEIDIGKGNRPLARYYPLEKLQLKKEVIFPKPFEEISSGLTEDYIELWNEFIKEVELINSIEDFDAYFTTIYNLLQKYTWCVPSAVWKDIPDVSLFDHLKTSCAIAACLFDVDEKYLDDLIEALARRYEILKELKGKIKEDVLTQELEKEWAKKSKDGGIEGNKIRVAFEDEKKFLLIGGDISGIQKFIYSISAPEEARRGMAKRLRGRSFYLNLLNDAIARKILSKLNLLQNNLLWCGGGHFTILAPYNEAVIQSLNDLKKTINTYLLKAFDGGLSLALNWLDASAKELEDFGALKERLAIQTTESKRQKFLSELSSNLFTPRDVSYRLCVVCGMDSEGLLCERCKHHEVIGGKLARGKYIVKIEGTDLGNCDLVEFDVGYLFVESQDEIIEGIRKISGEISKIQILSLNNTQFLDFYHILKRLPDQHIPVSFGFTFIGNTVPIHNLSILDFESIASLSKGAQKLGILKMDVDYLSKIFVSGLPKENRTVSRISTLSSMLDLFFLGYLNKITQQHCVYHTICDTCIQKSKTRMREINKTISKLGLGHNTEVYDVHPQFENELCETCKSEENRITKGYVIYSGGDDLLIVGPWDAAIETAFDIRTSFKEFVCYNDSLNISGGVFICNSRFPIGRAVRLADDHLDLAKSHLKDGNGSSLKNSITLFNECVCWDDMPGYQKKGFSDLFSLAKQLEILYESNEISKGFLYSLMRMWQRSFDEFGNDLKRIEDNRRLKHDHVPLLKYQLARTFKGKEMRDEVEKMVKPFMPWIRIPVSWVSLRTR